MADDSNEEQRNQVYLSEREFGNLQSEYLRTYFRKDHPHSMLLYAKSYFIKQKYQQCIDILQKVEKCYSTKVLFERQALLFKACYLKNNNDLATLSRIVADYESNKHRCPGKALTNFHHNQIKQLMTTIIKGNEASRKSEEVNKQELKNIIKAEQKKNKYEGFPSFLITVNWNKKFNSYLLRDGPFPGPITNFELINHVFELEPHHEHGKQYMDKLMFPLTEEDNYYSLRKNHWQLIVKIFTGIEVKRIFATNQKNRQVSGGDNLIKTVILQADDKYVMQWQSGTYWQKSIIPSLTAKFGNGQLKQQTRNKDFLVIQPGRAEQPYYPLKYVNISSNLLKVQNQKEEKRKKKIQSNYDLQVFDPHLIKSKGTVGLVNLGNTCYMNSALQFLCNLRTFADYFLTNKYLEKVNITDTNKQGSYGQVLCAFADLVKRLWFSHKDTRYIDPSTFKRAFGQRHSMFIGNQQQDAQQFLMFLLSCLHEDVNENAQMNLMHRQSMGGKAFDTVRNIALGHYKKHNKSIISDLFHGFLYEEIMCDECKFITFRFQHFLMLHVQAPPEAPKISVFMVQAKDLTQAKKIQVYISKIKTVGQVQQIIRKHFTVDQKNEIISFIYYDQQKNWQILSKQTEPGHITRAYTKSGYFFMFQVRKPQPDEQLAMISYFYQSRIGYEVDGFPRFVTVKKNYRQEQYQEELKNVVFQTFTKKRITRDKKDYIKDIKMKKVKGKAYQVNYRVQMGEQIKNYANTPIDRILGENDNVEGFDLQGCLSRLSKQQIIDQWKCQKCNQQRSAHKTDKIYSTSKYLIIQIKRFTQSGKICSKIDYPINNLNMKPFIYQQHSQPAPTAPPSSSIISASQPNSNLYTLQAVILHRGSLNSGHYTCISRNFDKDGWLYYDDQSVREIQEIHVVDANAYMLVYEKQGKQEDFMLSSGKYMKMGLNY